MQKEKKRKEELNSSTEGMPELEQVPAEALGLHLITKKSTGWPGNLTLQDIMNGIDNKIYKWTHTNNDIPDNIMYKMLKNNEINLKNCFGSMDKTNFKKLTNGRAMGTPAASRMTKPKPKNSNK